MCNIVTYRPMRRVNSQSFTLSDTEVVLVESNLRVLTLLKLCISKKNIVFIAATLLLYQQMVQLFETIKLCTISLISEWQFYFLLYVL
jgi:hypothetical protein